jgi:cytochrome c peroxidase
LVQTSGGKDPNDLAWESLQLRFRASRSPLFRVGLLLVMLVGVAASIFAGSLLPNPLNSNDATGTLSTYSTAGGVDQSNPFFQKLGTNGRTCLNPPVRARER